MRDEVAGEKQVARGGNEVSGLVPEVGQPQQRKMQQPERAKDQPEGRQGPGQPASAGRAARFCWGMALVDGAALRDLRIELDFAEGLLVVGHILLQHQGERLGLLRDSDRFPES